MRLFWGKCRCGLCMCLNSTRNPLHVCGACQLNDHQGYQFPESAKNTLAYRLHLEGIIQANQNQQLKSY